jgi:hypothetical protein
MPLARPKLATREFDISKFESDMPSHAEHNEPHFGKMRRGIVGGKRTARSRHPILVGARLNTSLMSNQNSLSYLKRWGKQGEFAPLSGFPKERFSFDLLDPDWGRGKPLAWMSPDCGCRRPTATRYLVKYSARSIGS